MKTKDMAKHIKGHAFVGAILISCFVSRVVPQPLSMQPFSKSERSESMETMSPVGSVSGTQSRSLSKNFESTEKGKDNPEDRIIEVVTNEPPNVLTTTERVESNSPKVHSEETSSAKSVPTEKEGVSPSSPNIFAATVVILDVSTVHGIIQSTTEQEGSSGSVDSLTKLDDKSEPPETLKPSKESTTSEAVKEGRHNAVESSSEININQENLEKITVVYLQNNTETDTSTKTFQLENKESNPEDRVIVVTQMTQDVSTSEATSPKSHNIEVTRQESTNAPLETSAHHSEKSTRTQRPEDCIIVVTEPPPADDTTSCDTTTTEKCTEPKTEHSTVDAIVERIETEPPKSPSIDTSKTDCESTTIPLEDKMISMFTQCDTSTKQNTESKVSLDECTSEHTTISTTCQESTTIPTTCGESTTTTEKCSSTEQMTQTECSSESEPSTSIISDTTTCLTKPTTTEECSSSPTDAHEITSECTTLKVVTSSTTTKPCGVSIPSLMDKYPSPLSNNLLGDSRLRMRQILGRHQPTLPCLLNLNSKKEKSISKICTNTASADSTCTSEKTTKAPILSVTETIALQGLHGVTTPELTIQSTLICALTETTTTTCAPTTTEDCLQTTPTTTECPTTETPKSKHPPLLDLISGSSRCSVSTTSTTPSYDDANCTSQTPKSKMTFKNDSLSFYQISINNSPNLNSFANGVDSGSESSKNSSKEQYYYDSRTGVRRYDGTSKPVYEPETDFSFAMINKFKWSHPKKPKCAGNEGSTEDEETTTEDEEEEHRLFQSVLNKGKTSSKEKQKSEKKGSPFSLNLNNLLEWD